jgi:hypothetical protein
MNISGNEINTYIINGNNAFYYKSKNIISSWSLK